VFRRHEAGDQNAMAPKLKLIYLILVGFVDQSKCFILPFLSIKKSKKNNENIQEESPWMKEKDGI
jgi:hypothetical protein